MSNCELQYVEPNPLITYNFWNKAATDIKYVLVESFESVEYFWKVLNSMSM